MVWDFGDGATSSQLTPGNHTFATAGSYAVTLTATDAQGLADPTPATRTVTVEGANRAPDAVITQPTGNVTIAAGQTVSFAATASDPDGDAVTVVWDFGDGITSSQLTPGNHTFATPGTFTVTLAATDSQNLADPTPATRVISVTQASPTLTQVQNEIFTPRCASCHGGSSPDARMNLQAGQSWSNLVNVPATTRNGLRVVPFSPASSALVKELEGGHRSLPTNLIQTIRDWISAGAADN